MNKTGVAKGDEKKEGHEEGGQWGKRWDVRKEGVRNMEEE